MKPTAIMVDIDGTLAHRIDRSPYHWSKVGEDKLDETIAELINKYPRVVLLSGRDSVCRPETEEWLKRYKINYDLLVMRVKNDNRKDSIVKLEMYKAQVEPNYDIKFVLDDRNQVVEMWRKNGLKCLQVAAGDF